LELQMPREATLTFDVVAAECARRRAAGEPISVKALIGSIGGSATTVAEHLRAWRSRYPATPLVPGTELPPDVVAALNGWRDRVRAATLGELSTQIDEANADREAIAAESARLRSALDDALEAAASAQAERDTARGQVLAHADEISRLATDLARERDNATGLTVAVNMLERQVAELAPLRESLERERQRAESAREESATLRGRLEAAASELERLSTQALPR
jgi:DNA repair exonuclease SbcCD ATPase subunit